MCFLFLFSYLLFNNIIIAERKESLIDWTSRLHHWSPFWVEYTDFWYTSRPTWMRPDSDVRSSHYWLGLTFLQAHLKLVILSRNWKMWYTRSTFKLNLSTRIYFVAVYKQNVIVFSLAIYMSISINVDMSSPTGQTWNIPLPSRRWAFNLHVWHRTFFFTLSGFDTARRRHK